MTARDGKLTRRVCVCVIATASGLLWALTALGFVALGIIPT